MVDWRLSDTISAVWDHLLLVVHIQSEPAISYVVHAYGCCIAVNGLVINRMIEIEREVLAGGVVSREGVLLVVEVVWVDGAANDVQASSHLLFRVDEPVRVEALNAPLKEVRGLVFRIGRQGRRMLLIGWLPVWEAELLLLLLLLVIGRQVGARRSSLDYCRRVQHSGRLISGELVAVLLRLDGHLGLRALLAKVLLAWRVRWRAL